MLMSHAVDKIARNAKGKKANAGKAFVPFIAADFDDSRCGDLVIRLRAAQYEGQMDAGLYTCLACMYHAKHATDDTT